MQDCTLTLNVLTTTLFFTAAFAFSCYQGSTSIPDSLYSGPCHGRGKVCITAVSSTDTQYSCGLNQRACQSKDDLKISCCKTDNCNVPDASLDASSLDYFDFPTLSGQAEEGNLVARYFLAEYYFSCAAGSECPKRKEAFLQLASAGHWGAQGICSRHRWGNYAQEKSAVAFWRDGNDRGDPVSMFNLGVEYKGGFSLTKNDKNSQTFFKEAAKKGYLPASCFLPSSSSNPRVTL
uniref:Uncharacterized protein n=1 Tax=Palpitomonas bilix TaxID=652834 RepID=A0A7S3D9X3_9EUKA|mmetsp:Transcript_28361/g.72277  ORF Transcript_28361/g.72277 Transcript_28361/m.72277 type:complete len:235 (+) Transcript_28361:293-997(+)